MKIALPLLLLFSVSAHSAECISYAGETILTGKLARRTFPEQPNYESIAKGDVTATYFFVAPKQPTCVAEGRNRSGLEPAESAVAEIQLAFLDGKRSYRQLRPYLGQEIVCRGTIYHAHTGHHHSSVLLFGAQCRPARQGR